MNQRAKKQTNNYGIKFSLVAWFKEWGREKERGEVIDWTSNCEPFVANWSPTSHPEHAMSVTINPDKLNTSQQIMFSYYQTIACFHSSDEKMNKVKYIKFSRKLSRFNDDVQCINLMLNTKLDAIIQHSHKIE